MLLDIKLGLVWALLVGAIFGEPFTLWWFLAGAAFALLPDIDALIELSMSGTISGKTAGAHRTLLHQPLLYVPVVVVVWVFAGSAWGILLMLGIAGHFAHDLVGMGYGVRLFWPFSKRWYKCFSSKDGEIHYDRRHLVVSWSDEEMRALLDRRGNDAWLRDHMTYHWHHRWTILGQFVVTIAVAAALVWIVSEMRR